MNIEVPDGISITSTHSYANGVIIVMMMYLANIIKASAAVAQLVVVCIPEESLHGGNE